MIFGQFSRIFVPFFWRVSILFIEEFSGFIEDFRGLEDLTAPL